MFFIIPAVFTALAAFFNLQTSIVLISLFFILKKLLFGGIFLTCGLPTLAGAATFTLIQKSASISAKYLNFWLQFLLPLTCMLLFVFNSVVGSAFLYSFYWFIPMILYFVKSKNVFVAALSSTFVAHAVGSILYLYSTNMPPDKWLALIPVVAFERFVAAFGVVLFYMAIKWTVGLGVKKYLRN